MNTKLTLRLDSDLIRQAKEYAADEGKSLSQIVGDYFTAIRDSRTEESRPELHPRCRKLLGALKDAEVDEESYRTHLEEKYL